MKVQAKISFAGAFSMYKGQVLECSDNVILQDLLSCGYIEEVTEKQDIKPKKEAVTKVESKRSKSK